MRSHYALVPVTGKVVVNGFVRVIPGEEDDPFLLPSVTDAYFDGDNDPIHLDQSHQELAKDALLKEHHTPKLNRRAFGSKLRIIKSGLLEAGPGVLIITGISPGHVTCRRLKEGDTLSFGHKFISRDCESVPQILQEDLVKGVFQDRYPVSRLLEKANQYLSSIIEAGKDLEQDTSVQAWLRLRDEYESYLEQAGWNEGEFLAALERL